MKTDRISPMPEPNTPLSNRLPLRLSLSSGVRVWSLGLVLLTQLVFSSGSGALQAAEPYLNFVQGLRARQYYDTAIQYLQSLEERSDVPPEIKVLIPYEKAVTLVEGSQQLQNPDAQSTQLEQAQAFLERFLKDSPNHELAPVANSELARIMLGKAQVLIWRSRSPSNAENRAKFQQDARKLVQQAKVIFQKAHDGYKKEWESFGVFIPEEETQKRAARAKVEGLYMRAQLDLASADYEAAQTYDKGTKEFNDALKKASMEFENLHTKYRSQYAGLFARTMQGKCFEEQDDIRKALGIYDELLSHGGQSAGLKRLQEQVLHFRLICLNHDSRKDYNLIIQEAGDWLRLNRAIARSTTGLGIRWELARAQESLANSRTTQEADRLRLLRQSLENAREINKYAGPYKDVSNSMIQRLLVSLDREPGDPKDFDTAFGMANTMLEQIGELREKLKAVEKSGNKEEITKAQEELQALLSETERLYRLALALSTSQTAENQIHAARYRLAYMFYLQRKSFETAVVGEYLSVRAQKADPAMALDGAYLAMAGYSQAYNDAPEAVRDGILSSMVTICERIAHTWPDSDRATDARMEMGRIYRRNQEPVKAAEWFAQIPVTVPQYADSQLEAGQAYWNAYLHSISNPESTVTAEELKSWQDQAAKHLQAGLTKKQEGVPATSETPAEITRGKVSLSQIEIMRGNEAKAVELLTAEPHSVIKAVSLPEGQQRPKEEHNIRSTTFASFAYQQLLRAYIGLRQLDKAEEARAALEKVAGESGGEALTAVYVELGRELHNELERLKKLGDQKRLEDVRNGFESFLSNLFARKDGQTYGSLIWIAETYFGLAEGSEEAPQKEKEYYSSASKAYEEIIKKADSTPGFIDPSRLIGVKLRLVNCKRQEGDFDNAETIVKEILKTTPRALDAQIEAATLYQTWGNQAEIERLQDAIRGKVFDDGTAIWGWGNIVKRLQMLIESGQGTPEYHERSRESRYRLAESRLQYADKTHDLTAKEDNLKKAKFELLAYTSITPDLPETAWWSKFDTIYQQIQRTLGEAALPLTKPDIALVASKNTISGYDTGNELEEVPATPVAQKTQATNAAPAKSDKTMTYALMGLLILGGGGAAVYMSMKPKKPKRKLPGMETATAVPQSLANPAAVPRKKPRPAVASSPAATEQAQTATLTAEKLTAEQKPTRPRPAEQTGEPRRRERPQTAQASPEQAAAKPQSQPQRRPQPRPADSKGSGEQQPKPVRRKPPEQT